MAQALTGISPVTESECHYWGHSFLGLGSANIALWNICSFLQRTLGEARIAGRVRSLARVANQKDYLNSNLELNMKDFVGEANPFGDSGKLVPQIPFFSARTDIRAAPRRSACRSPSWWAAIRPDGRC